MVLRLVPRCLNNLGQMRTMKISIMPAKPRGRRTSATTVLPSNSKFFDYTTSRVFTREYLMRYGTKTLDDALLVLNPGSKLKTRRLDEKKRKQLSQLYFETVAGIICEIPEAAEHKIIITKVDIPHHMTEIKVYWKAFGDTRDITVKEFLESNSEMVRNKLSETLYHSNVPKLAFYADREHLLLEVCELYKFLYVTIGFSGDEQSLRNRGLWNAVSCSQ